MDPLTPTVESPDSPDVRALLERHFVLMRSQSPAESCHVMPPDSVAEKDVTLLGLRQDGVLLGIGALAIIAPSHGELKSMHTASEARGKGVARQLLNALIALARSEGATRLSLETGSAPAFAPARALYQTAGFQNCPPFGDYIIDPLSVFMTRTL